MSVAINGSARIEVVDGALSVDGEQCDSARTTNIDQVAVAGTGGNDSLVLADPAACAPGATDEGDGSSEIEISVDLGFGDNALQLEGTTGSDRWVIGAAGLVDNGDDDLDVDIANIDRVDMYGIGGADTLSGQGGGVAGAATSLPLLLMGGSGNDVLTGGSNNDLVFGGDGSDSITGRGGDDLYGGGSGNDTLMQSPVADGSDVLGGGAGSDVVRYDGRALGVTVTIGAGANDGVSGEGDDVQADVEQVRGSRGDDRLFGSPSRDALFGGGGDDVITGRGGRDTLDGGRGNDTFRARDHARDNIRGGRGVDTCRRRQRDRSDRLASIEHR